MKRWWICRKLFPAAPPEETTTTGAVIRGAGIAVAKYVEAAFRFRNPEWQRRNLRVALEHARSAARELEVLLEKERKGL